MGWETTIMAYTNGSQKKEEGLGMDWRKVGEKKNIIWF